MDVTHLGSPDLITKLWREYLAVHEANSTKFVPYRYEQVSRRSFQARKFEDMLFVQYGATVRQINGQRFLEFADQNQALMFALTTDIE